MLVLFVCSIALLAVSSEASEGANQNVTAKPLGSICDPDVEGECGEFAVCHVPKFCALGRCACQSDQYRPEAASDDKGMALKQVNCTQIKRLGDKCSVSRPDQVEKKAGHICSREFNNVTCKPNFERSGDNHCEAGPNVVGYGEKCGGDDGKVCNPLIGLTCGIVDGSDEKRCKCVFPNMVIHFSSSYQYGEKCTLLKYGDRCSSHDHCAGPGNLRQSICATNTTNTCECGLGYKAKPYFENSLPGSDDTNAAIVYHCMKDTLPETGMLQRCSVVGPAFKLTTNSALCFDELVCYNCPEFSQDRNGEIGSDDKDIGKCFSLKVFNSQPPALSSTFLMPMITWIVIAT